MVSIIWTGAAGLEFRYKEQVLLVDPYYSRPGKRCVFFKTVVPDADLVSSTTTQIGPVTGIVVAHTHFDHALDISEFARHYDCPLIGSRSLKTLMDKIGLGHRVHVCSGGEAVMVSQDIDVIMHPSVHGRVVFGRIPCPGEIDPLKTLPMKAGDYRSGTVFTPEIRIGGRIFLHVGSAGFNDNAICLKRCDVLFLCVPGWKKTPGYPERLLELTRPESVVLFHHDNFFIPLSGRKHLRSFPFLDIRGLERRIRDFDPTINIIKPRMFEPIFVK